MVEKNISKGNKELVIAMQDSANELDRIVRRINKLLDVDGSFNREEIEKLNQKENSYCTSEKGSFQ